MSATPTKPGDTIEKLLDMTLAQLQALTPEQVAEFVRPALEMQREVLANAPAPRKVTGIHLGKKPQAYVSPDAKAIIGGKLAEAGIDLELLKKLGGIKL